MSSRFIRATFQCPDVPPASNPPTIQPTLAHFIAYALYRTRLPHFVTLVALVYLQRLKHRYPSAKGSSGHRLFISAFMIASKVVCDDTYSNQSWCIVGQKMFALKEMNQMEREMCGYLDWQLVSRGEQCLKGRLAHTSLILQNATAEEVEDFDRVVTGEHSNAALLAKRQAALLAQQQPREQELARPSPSSPTSSEARPTAPLPAKRPKVVGRMESSASVIPVTASEAVAASVPTSFAPSPRVASVPSISTFAPSIDVPWSSSGYAASAADVSSTTPSRAFQASANGSTLTATRPTTRRTASSINTTRKPHFTTGFEHVPRQHVRRAGLSGGSTPSIDMPAMVTSQLDSTYRTALASDSGCLSSDDLTSSTHSSPDSQLCQTPETTFVHPADTVDGSGRLSPSCPPRGKDETVFGAYSVYGCSDMPMPIEV